MMKWTLLFLAATSLAGADDFQAGFYRVNGDDKECKKMGPIIYMNLDSIKTSEKCTFTFENNDIRTVGLCTRILAHRGDARKYAANTVGAFDAALDRGFKGFELDIQLSKDHKAIVSHDDKLKVATDCKGRITEKTAEEIAACTATRTSLLPETKFLSHKAKISQPMPPLKEVLARYLDDKRAEQIVLDVKPNPGGQNLLDAFQDAFPLFKTREEQAAFEKRITFISQNKEEVKILKEAYPNAHVAIESNRTVSGLIDDTESDLWDETCTNDTLSLSINSLFDFKLKLVKFLKGEDSDSMRRWNELYEENNGQQSKKRLMGWTLNTKGSVKSLHNYDFQDALTDMRYDKVMNILAKDLTLQKIEANIDNIKRGEGRKCD